MRKILLLALCLMLSINVLVFGETNEDEPAVWAESFVEQGKTLELIPISMQNNYTQTITREEFCELAVLLIERKSQMDIESYIQLRGLTLADKNTFEDTRNDAILAAKTLGITGGTSATTFSPANLLTREQAATFLSNTAKAVGEDITAQIPTYTDLNDIAEWARPFTGYVYDMDVMRGVGENKFNPKGGYQRQQAYITMVKLFGAIEEVSEEKVVTSEEEASQEVVMDSSLDTPLSDIKTELNKLLPPQTFTMNIEGEIDRADGKTALKYDVYYKGTNVRIDTYWDTKNVSKSIYNALEDKTYTELMLYTHYGEMIDGNMLPIRLIDVETLEALEIDTDLEFFTAHYDLLDGEKVLYMKSDMRNGVTQEFWYSLTYLVPIKYHEENLEEGYLELTDWHVVMTKEEAIADDMFDIPEDVTPVLSEEDYYGENLSEVRSQLLYKMDSVDVDEINFLGMTQIFYYSKETHINLTAYFSFLLKDTADYSIDFTNEKSIIEGTLYGDQVIIIVNNYMETENNNVNGINLNFYE